MQRKVRADPKSNKGLIRSLGNGVRKNGIRNRCPYRRCGVDTEIPYRLPFWREFCLNLQVCVASGVDTEFPYRVCIVDRGVDCRDPVCRHHFRFLDYQRVLCSYTGVLEFGLRAGGGRGRVAVAKSTRRFLAWGW